MQEIDHLKFSDIFLPSTKGKKREDGYTLLLRRIVRHPTTRTSNTDEKDTSHVVLQKCQNPRKCNAGNEKCPNEA